LEIGLVKFVDIEQEMRGAYLDYAMSVITARALPDVRDGLKPVQRRILYAMGEMGLRHNTPYKKCARVVGDVLGRYHPHGDAAVYEALVRMAQDFSMRYTLVDGQGNFGSVDGDPPAAMRYTECRLTPIAEEMLQDIDRDTVDFAPNFDATLQEPTVLPAKLPNLLVNGASGIAVGMATNIPPHNLGEVCDAICYLIDHPEATTEDLSRYILGPDFPTGGIIMGLEGIKAAYATGKGRILVRARAFVEEARGDRQNIIITELPYQVNKAALLERIAELLKDGRLEGIADMRDESDRQGMRVVIELKKGVEAHTVLNLLYKYTAMQTAFGVNMLALVNGEPRILPLKRILQYYIDYRHQVITRRTRFDLERTRARAHILEGLKIALDRLDEVIATIRQSPDAETAKTRLMKNFLLDDPQAQAIMDMQLRRLARLEREKIEQELKDARKLIAYLEDLLAYPRKIYTLIKDELRELKRKYGDARRTHIYEQEAVEFTTEDLIPDEKVIVAITQKGYLKRYRPPRRSSRQTLSREADPERDLCLLNMHDTVLFLTDAGRICSIRCHEIPEADRSDRGTPIGNLITLNGKETVVNIIPLPREVPADASLAIVTRHGKVKRTAIGEFSAVRGSGIIAIGLEDGDTPVAGRLIQNGDEFLLVTCQGQAIRFSQDEVRPMGRAATGVTAIRLEGPNDAVAAFDVVRPAAQEAASPTLLVVTAQGQGKRSPLTDFPIQGRAGSGVTFVKVSPKTGPVVAARVVNPGDEIAISTSDGQLWRGPAEVVPQKARTHALAPVPELNLTGKSEVVSGLAIYPGERTTSGPAPGAGKTRRRAATGKEPEPPPVATEKPKRKKTSGVSQETGETKEPKARASPATARGAKGRRKREPSPSETLTPSPRGIAEAQTKARPRASARAEVPMPSDETAEPRKKPPAEKAPPPEPMARPQDSSRPPEAQPAARQARATPQKISTKKRSSDDIKVRFKGKTLWLSRE